MSAIGTPLGGTCTEPRQVGPERISSACGRPSGGPLRRNPMRLESGATRHTVSKKARCEFESKLEKCCPSITCTRIGSRSGSVSGGADHFVVPSLVFLRDENRCAAL